MKKPWEGTRAKLVHREVTNYLKSRPGGQEAPAEKGKFLRGAKRLHRKIGKLKLRRSRSGK